jgi:hypothetical protein
MYALTVHFTSTMHTASIMVLHTVNALIGIDCNFIGHQNGYALLLGELILGFDHHHSHLDSVQPTMIVFLQHSVTYDCHNPLVAGCACMQTARSGSWVANSLILDPGEVVLVPRHQPPLHPERVHVRVHAKGFGLVQASASEIGLGKTAALRPHAGVLRGQHLPIAVADALPPSDLAGQNEHHLVTPNKPLRQADTVLPQIVNDADLEPCFR